MNKAQVVVLVFVLCVCIGVWCQTTAESAKASIGGCNPQKQDCAQFGGGDQVGCNPQKQDCTRIGGGDQVVQASQGGDCVATVSGCECLDSWEYEGGTYIGCAVPSNWQGGSFCEFKSNTCKQQTSSIKYESCPQSCTPNTPQPDPQPGVNVQCPPLIFGLDYKGGDLSQGSYADSAEACQRRCGQTPDCLKFTFVKSQKSCWLKNTGYITQGNSNMISGDPCSL